MCAVDIVYTDYSIYLQTHRMDFKKKKKNL